MNKKQKHILLLTNDDGIYSKGLSVAYEALKHLEQNYDIYVVAPEVECSSSSHAVTLSRPIFCKKIKNRWFAMRGNPADCVFIACSDILPSIPKIVVSGINDGPNIGKDTFYSGTVGAAREGAFRGIPSIAISLIKGGSWEEAGRITTFLTQHILRSKIKRCLLLNINIPTGKIRGIKLTTLGRREYSDTVIKRESPRKETYYWINGGPADVFPGKGTDGEALKKGFVSITPLTLNMTDSEAIKKLSNEIFSNSLLTTNKRRKIR